MQETREFWRHRSFRDLGLLKARFQNHRYDLHTHPTYVIALITEGAERVRVGRETIVAPAGSVLVVNPEEWHDGEAGAADGWAYRTFYPTVPMMTEIAAELGGSQAPEFPRRLIEDPDLARLLAEAHAQSRAEDSARAEETMLAALRRLVRHHGGEPSAREEIDAMGSRHRMSLYEQTIEDNLNSDLDLKKLSDVAGVTRFQVIRDFKKIAGLTPAAFIRDRQWRSMHHSMETADRQGRQQQHVTQH